MVTNNDFKILLNTGYNSDQFINTQKVAKILRETCTCEILVVTVDLPACTRLDGVIIGPRVSCPNLTSASAVKLSTLEAMLYLVDSLSTLSTAVNDANTFVMTSAEAQKDTELFNELNAELKAKGWTAGVTLI